MGNKKRKTGPTIEEVLERPWCFYCERDFDDLKILISHQRAKHYKCPRCNRRLNTAGGLSVHLHQVHKESLKEIENALPNRMDPNLEIFGMEGIPSDIIDMHRKRVTDAFFNSESGQRAAENNANVNSDNKKRPRVEEETPEQIKARLEEHRARRRLEKEGGIVASNSPTTQSPQPHNAHDSPAPASANPVPPTLPIMYPPVLQPVHSAYPPQPYGGVPAVTAQIPPYHVGYPPVHGLPPVPNPMHHEQVAGPPHYALPVPPTVPAGILRTGISPVSRHPIPPPQSSSPAPSVPGLPQRPSFDSPHLTKEQMAQMHSISSGAPNLPNKPSAYGSLSSQAPAAPRVDNEARHDVPPLSSEQQGKLPEPAGEHKLPTNPLNSNPDTFLPNMGADPPASTEGKVSTLPDSKKEKKTKKSKEGDTSTRLVYSDKTTAPEEKRAKLDRYQPIWKQGNAPSTVLGDVGGGSDAVSGALDETVRDPQD